MSKKELFKSFGAATVLGMLLITPVDAATTKPSAPDSSLMTLSESASDIEGLNAGGLMASRASSDQVQVRTVWSSVFGTDAQSLKNSHLGLHIRVPSTKDGAGTITGEMGVGKDVYKIGCDQVNFTQHQTSSGVINSIEALGTLQTKHDTRRMAMLILYKPGDSDYEVSITVHDTIHPVYMTFGPTIFTPQQRAQAMMSDTESPLKSPNTLRPNSTMANASTPNNSNPWYYVSNGSTNVLAGTTLSGPSCVVLASDQLQGNSYMLRDQVWGGTAAVSYLASSVGVSSSNVSVNAVHFAVNDFSNFQLSGQNSPPSGTSTLATWSWVLSYVKWAGSALSALANQYITASVGNDTTLGDPHFQQMHYNYPSATCLTSTANVGNNVASYAEQFGSNAAGGEGVQVDGIVEYYVNAPGHGLLYDSDWVYSNGTM